MCNKAPQREPEEKGIRYDVYMYQYQCPKCHKITDVNEVTWSELSPVIQERVYEDNNRLILPHKCHICRKMQLRI